MIPRGSLRGRGARWYLRNYEKPGFVHLFNTVCGCLLLGGALGVAVLASWDRGWGAVASMFWTLAIIRLFYQPKGEG